MNPAKFKPLYAFLAAFAVVSAIIAASFYAAERPEPARAQTSNEISVEPQWLHIDEDSDSFTRRFSLDSPAESRLIIDFQYSLHRVICDTDCRLEKFYETATSSQASVRYASLEIGNTSTSIAYVDRTKWIMRDVMKKPAVPFSEEFPHGVVAATRVLEVYVRGLGAPVKIADGHDEYQLPEFVRARVPTARRSVKEGKEFYIPVKLNAPYERPIRVSYELVDETAVWNVDYMAKRTGTLTFQPGEQTARIPYRAAQNDRTDGDKTFRVILSYTSDLSELFDKLDFESQAVITIEDDERKPGLTIEATYKYGRLNPTETAVRINLEFALDGVTEQQVVVDYDLVEHLAATTTTTSHRIVFDPGENLKTSIEGGHNNLSNEEFEEFLNGKVRFTVTNVRVTESAAVYAGIVNYPPGRGGLPKPTPTPASTTESLPVIYLVGKPWLVGKPGESGKFTIGADKRPKLDVTADVGISFHEVVCDPDCRYVDIQGAGVTQNTAVSSQSVNLLGDATFNFPQNSSGGSIVALAKLQNPANGALSKAMPDPFLPALLKTSDLTVEEGDISGVQVYMDVAGRSAPSAPIDISYELVDKSAAFGKHYIAERSGVATIRAGKKNIQIPFRTLHNELPGTDKKFGAVLSLSDPINAIMMKRSGDSVELVEEMEATVNILDRERTIVAFTYTIRKYPDPDPKTFDNFHLYETTIRLSTPSEDDVEVKYQLAFPDENNEIALTYPGRTLTIPSGQIQAQDKLLYQDRSSFWHVTVDFTNAYEDKGDKYVTPDGSEILKTDVPKPTTPVTVTVSDVRVVEGQVAELEIAVSEPLSEDLVVNYVATDLSDTLGIDKSELASEGADFKRERRNATIPAGATSTIAYVWTNEDEHDEVDEKIIVKIMDLSIDGLESEDGFIIIEDNDDPPTVYIKSVELTELNGEQTIRIDLRLTARSDLPITQDFAVVVVAGNLSGASGPTGSVQVTFPPRVTRQHLTITLEDVGGAP